MGHGTSQERMEQRRVDHHPTGMQTDDKESWEEHCPLVKAEWSGSLSTTFLVLEAAWLAVQTATLCTDYDGHHSCEPEPKRL